MLRSHALARRTRRSGKRVRDFNIGQAALTSIVLASPEPCLQLPLDAVSIVERSYRPRNRAERCSSSVKHRIPESRGANCNKWKGACLATLRPARFHCSAETKEVTRASTLREKNEDSPPSWIALASHYPRGRVELRQDVRRASWRSKIDSSRSFSYANHRFLLSSSSVGILLDLLHQSSDSERVIDRLC